MNGKNIESVLERIDSNIDLARDEAAEYIRQNEKEIVQELAASGTATIRTKAGDIQLTLSDLMLTAA